MPQDINALSDCSYWTVWTVLTPLKLFFRNGFLCAFIISPKGVKSFTPIVKNAQNIKSKNYFLACQICPICPFSLLLGV